MCGIYGSTKVYNESQVKSKLKRTAFRGPDQMGWEFYKSDNYSIVFGHNRLSIIDLDARSNQPLSYLDNIEIVFNGEIFNFQDIKDNLHKKGYTFKTTSDTEVICAAYLEYGEDCVNHFNGFFAFVIYDKLNHCFFGARDRLGQKPFYYYHNGKDFEFASQVSSIQLHNNNLSISEYAIKSYLTWETIPDPLSIFNEIHKLLPGHSFKFDLTSGTFKTKQYWDIDYHGKNKFKGDYQDAKKELKDLLSNAVKIRMFADVPVGVFLSGGVDSSIIAAMASETYDGKVKTFSVKFNDKGFDESVYAAKVASHLQTEHNIIECNYNEGIELIENFHHYYDEPFADSSAIPSMLLAKHTKKQVTVAISGDAGDESFSGYHRYNWINQGAQFMKIPYPIRVILSKLTSLAPTHRLKVISKYMAFKSIESIYLDSLSDISLSGHSGGKYVNEVEELKYLIHNNKNLLERVSDFDLKTYLNWDINTKVDRATMAYSLEARSPLMDYRVVEFARSLPTEFKFKGGNQKRILKDVLYQYVPKEYFDRPKAGFTMPFENWFRQDLKEYVLTELSKDGLKVIPGINIEDVSNRINKHMDGSANNYPLIWKLLVLKQWLNNNKGYEIR
ncbi:Asparagine synthetase [Winogradskyella psychrotolerans RS-3]|uniref:asparagine synthase (glutamine-hydrolyzing) n=1 Tax=Winogradskyella psychrotolerans RS-3 TaxID=641526 RepID=S7VHQ7_9FLAO|nr:asparagine synthase (glutamine-hydrolyzing) [Winogradskyella psychrotolerans]EPR69715.1 Asparagine synthetase [Winogradskyella psychrotolerans RS-3]